MFGNRADVQSRDHSGGRGAQPLALTHALARSARGPARRGHGAREAAVPPAPKGPLPLVRRAARSQTSRTFLGAPKWTRTTYLGSLDIASLDNL